MQNEKIEIIYIAENQRTAVEQWEDDVEEYSKYGPLDIRRHPLEIKTPTCRIRYRSRNAKNRGLRADLVYPHHTLPEIMCRSAYTEEDCREKNLRRLIIVGLQQNYNNR